MFAFTTTIIALFCLSWSTTHAQQQPPTQPTAPPNPNGQTNVCGAKFEADLDPVCFSKAGVPFSGILYVFSGNRSGDLPEGYTYNSFLEFLCSTNIQDFMVPCVLQQMQKYNSSAQCTEEDRLGVLGRGGQLLAFMDAICGEPCEQEATQSLIQCYAAINVNPEPILNQNASIADDKFSVFGDNETEFDNFCRNRQKLFSCLSPLYSTCPGLLERLYTIGIDLQAMEAVSDVLCSTKQKYFKALGCFTTPSPSITQCRQQTESNMRQVLVGRYQTGDVPPSTYMSKLCQAKLTQVDCELSAFAQSCDADIADLRNTVECAMLPTPCRSKESSGGASFGPIYDKLCAEVTTPAPATVRPTQPSGGPGVVPGTGNNLGNDDDDDDDDDDSGATTIATSGSIATILLLVFGLMFVH